MLPRRTVFLVALFACSLVAVSSLAEQEGEAVTLTMSQNQQESWASLVGLDKDDAKNALQRSHPELKVLTVGPGRVVTADYVRDRVRIYFDEQGKVVREPRRG